MRKKLQLALLALLVSMGAKAQLSSNPDKFLGNITTSYNVDYGKEAFHTLWNQITCENETKWASVEGTNDRFNWNDAAFNYAKKWNFPFKFHALVWGSQYPSWIESLTPEQRYNEIVQWMDNVKKHYPDLKIIDVVNEAVSGHQEGTKYFIEALGGTGETGYDWIIKAFELAYERWPDAILIYNDFNTFQCNTDQYIDLVKNLRNAGAPIDAYGCQSHDLTDCSESAFIAAMEKLQNALKMPMYSTEYDIGTDDDDKQLQRYKEQIPYMWEQDYCAGVTLWGYIYGKTWTTDGNSGIIIDGEDRPAMTWLREYMQTDEAKNAKSPFPGMVKEASVYVKPVYAKVEKGKDAKIIVRAKMRTKTIEKIELYARGSLVATMTEAPYEAIVNFTNTKACELKAVVTCTDGTTYERYSSVQPASAQEPYTGTAIELPGVIEAENYDKGSIGIAYWDTSTSREGTASSYRTDGADIDKAGSGYALGCNKVGEWVEYTVNVKEPGLYAVNTKYSATKEGASYNLSLVTIDGPKTLTEEKITVPATSSKSDYQTKYTRTIVPLEAGEQVIRLTITGGADNVLNIDNIAFEHLNINEDIELEIVNDDEEFMYDTKTTFTANVSATEEIQDVKYYADGVLCNTSTEAPYTFEFTPAKVGQYEIMAYATTVSGNQSELVKRTINVVPKSGPFNGIKYIPGVVEAEDFDMGGDGVSFHDSDTNDQGKAGYRTDNEGVDIKKITGGYAIGNTAVGEWLDYTIEVTEAGKYKFEAVVSSTVSGSKFQLGFVNGDDVSYLRAFGVPETGSGVFTTVTSKSTKELEEGRYKIRIYISAAGCEIDKINIVLDGVDDIDEIPEDNASESGAIYNIAGQRVSETYKGVIIKNGKKILVK